MLNKLTNNLNWNVLLLLQYFPSLLSLTLIFLLICLHSSNLNLKQHFLSLFSYSETPTSYNTNEEGQLWAMQNVYLARIYLSFLIYLSLQLRLFNVWICFLVNFWYTCSLFFILTHFLLLNYEHLYKINNQSNRLTRYTYWNNKCIHINFIQLYLFTRKE